MITRNQPGFTLIELLVAITVFSAIILIANGIFTQFIAAQRRNISEQNLQEEIRFSVEFLARELNTAYASTFTPAAGGSQLYFRDQHEQCVTHRLNNGSWERAAADINDSRECYAIGNHEYTFVPLTSSSIRMNQLSFNMPTITLVDVTAEKKRLDRQGFVTVTVEAAAADITVPPLSLQTTITSRQSCPYTERDCL